VSDSVPGTFSLRVSAPLAPAQPPGARLPAGGVTRTLDRAENTDDAWSVLLRSGVTYRLRLSGRGDTCRPAAQVYPPGTASFDGQFAYSVSCGHTLIITPRPGEGGRYPIHVVASRTARAAQGYHLQVARATADDTAPGIGLFNHVRTRGSLRGDTVDGVDIYRFVISQNSFTRLALDSAGDFRVSLFAERGQLLGNDAAAVEHVLRPGTYYAAVRAVGAAAGRYRLRRDSQAITHISLNASGASRAGSPVTLSTSVTPAASGPIRIVIERRDPLAGWLFADQLDLRAAADGRATGTFVPTGGRYRARAEFRGTRDAAASTSRYVRFRVSGGPRR
jgi:hypothetical protein